MKESQIRKVKNLNRCGAYWIRNLVTDKVYIGATSRTFALRWKTHLSQLRQGKHSNPHLQKAWGQYGETAFEFTILETTLRGESPRQVEQKWLDKVKLDGFKVYNTEAIIRRVATRWTMSQEAKDKISVAMQGNKRGLGKKRPQHAIDATVKARAMPHAALRNVKTGQHVPTGTNVSKLARQLHIPRTTLRHVLSGYVKQTRTGWMLAALEVKS